MGVARERADGAMVVAMARGSRGLYRAAASVARRVEAGTVIWRRCCFAGLDEIAVFADDVGNERAMEKRRDRARRYEKRGDACPKASPAAGEGRQCAVGSAAGSAMHGLIAFAGPATDVKNLPSTSQRAGFWAAVRGCMSVRAKVSRACRIENATAVRIPSSMLATRFLTGSRVDGSRYRVAATVGENMDASSNRAAATIHRIVTRRAG